MLPGVRNDDDLLMESKSCRYTIDKLTSFARRPSEGVMLSLRYLNGVIGRDPAIAIAIGFYVAESRE